MSLNRNKSLACPLRRTLKHQYQYAGRDGDLLQDLGNISLRWIFPEINAEAYS